MISSLAHELSTPERIESYARRYIDAKFKDERDSHRRRADMEKRLAQIEAENMRLVKLMVQDGADTKTLGALTKENGQERDRLSRHHAIGARRPARHCLRHRSAEVRGLPFSLAMVGAVDGRSSG